MMWGPTPAATPAAAAEAKTERRLIRRFDTLVTISFASVI
jgi:hypothetical protein